MSDKQEELHEERVPEVKLPERPESDGTTALPVASEADAPAAVGETVAMPASVPPEHPEGRVEIGEAGREAAREGHEAEGHGHAPRVARSVSNKPLIDETKAREHAAAKAKSQSGNVKVRPAVRRGTPRARRMNLSLTRINVWSVAKVSFMMSIAGALIQIIAAALIWLLLNVVGVFDQITQIVSSTGLNADGFNLAQVFSLPTVLSAVTIFSIVEIVLLTLLAVIVAAIYNVVSSLVGGVHITLGDD